MSAAPVSLDNGPPLPPGLQPPQQASAQQLAGQQANAGQGSAQLQQAIVQKAMGVEQLLNDIGSMVPDAGPVMAGFIDQFRKALGGVLAKGAQPPVAPGLPGASLLMSGGQPSS
jgi:hypothetical protein